jgi:hypothetical protein
MEKVCHWIKDLKDPLSPESVANSAGHIQFDRHPV